MIFLIGIRLGSCEVRRLNLALAALAKRTITKNRMQMIISPTRLTQHQRVLRELEGI